MKTEKMKENRAGSYIPEEFAREFLDEVEKNKDDFPEGFLAGAACALSYLICPKSVPVYGKTHAEYIRNAAIGFKVASAKGTAFEKAEEDALRIVEALEAAGFHVDDAYLVEVK